MTENGMADLWGKAGGAKRSVSVLLPLALPGPYDYLLPEDLEAEVGACVVVPLGPRRLVGVVWGTAVGDVPAAKLKPVEAVLDVPMLPKDLRKLIDWVAAYTISPPGAVLRMAMRAPSVFEPEKPRYAYRATGIMPPRMTAARERVLMAASDGLVRSVRQLAEEAGCSDGVVRGLIDAGSLEAVEIATRAAPARLDPALRAFLAGDATRWALLNKPSGAFSVEAQIAHVARAIHHEHAAAKSQGRRFVVVAHSIGGFFALNAKRDVPVICVTPYLENREEDPAFRKLRRLITSPVAPLLAFSVASVAALLGVFPKIVRRRLLRAAGATSGMDRVHEDVTAETMCGFGIRGFGNVITTLGLARSELRDLREPFDGPYPAALILFDPPDVWCAAAGPLVDRAKDAGTLMRLSQDTPHAFSTQPDARRRVVATIAELVAKVAA